MVVTRLPALSQHELKAVFYLQVYVEGTHGRPPRITRDNARGYAVFSRESHGVMCRYFRRVAGDPGYEHIEKVDSLGGTTFSSLEMTLLHFASFDRVPSDSGIYTFRRDLTTQEANTLKRVPRGQTHADLDDAICGDGSLNMGVIFLNNNNNTPGDATCGVPCTKGGFLMYCAEEQLTGSRHCKIANETCKSSQLALVLANRAPAGKIPVAAVTLQRNLELFRAFRDAFLRQSPVGLKYVGYYRLFSKYATLDAPVVAKYVAALPHIYKAISALIYGSGQEIVVTPALYAKAISIIDSLSKTRNKHFRSMLADVRQDLAAARGLTRAALSQYMDHPTTGGNGRQVTT